MRTLGAAEIDAALEIEALIDALRRSFRAGAVVPVRHHHRVEVPGAADGTLLLMPAWQAGGHMGVKVVSVFPDNARRGLPSVLGAYLLLAAGTGEVLALLDGPMLTLRRTAAASALAASYLARRDAARLLMVGTGALAPHLVRAHAAVRPIGEVRIWGRTPSKARALAQRLDAVGLAAEATDDLAASVPAADVITCATMAIEPLIEGAWLRPGQHLDLVGGYRPDMREADDEAVRRATVFVDTRAGACTEAGDIVQAVAGGALDADTIAADLFDLCRGDHPGRRDDDEITFFKSVGTALEDLAAAELAVSAG